MDGSREQTSRRQTNRRITKKKFEFSKLILISIGLVTLVVTIFTMSIIWKTGDTTPLAYLIPAVFAELATATGFYYYKAKAENLLKIAKSEGTEFLNQTGINQL